MYKNDSTQFWNLNSNGRCHWCSRHAMPSTSSAKTACVHLAPRCTFGSSATIPREAVDMVISIS